MHAKSEMKNKETHKQKEIKQMKLKLIFQQFYPATIHDNACSFI